MKFFICLFGLYLLLVSCATEPWRVKFLKDAVGKATKDDVLTVLGPPDVTAEKRDGGEIWRYRHVQAHTQSTVIIQDRREQSAFERGLERGRQAVSSSQPGCVQYILGCDSPKILRSWVRTDC